MVRSVLKPHATLFAAILRICDPVLMVLVGFVAYRAYLGSFAPPDHYVLFLAVGALAVAVVFPMFHLYEPQRGAGVARNRAARLRVGCVGAFAGGAILRP
jgi:hypothetical protein